MFCKPKPQKQCFCSYNRQLNCKNSAQNALEVDILRSKVKKIFEEGALFPPQTLHVVERGHPFPIPHSLGAFGASILAPAALDLGPPFANPGSATGYTS